MLAEGKIVAYLIFSKVFVTYRILPPYIVHEGKNLWSTWICKNSYPGTRVNVSDSGWVEEHVFFDWLSKQFIPFVADVRKPILLIFDGHQAHISTRISKLAMDHRIELLCLPPHSTTILQPLDVVTLTKVKTSWRKLLQLHNTQTNSQKIDKKRFSYLVSVKPVLLNDIHLCSSVLKIGKLWKDYILPSHCSAGFSRAGVYPYDPRAVSKEKIFEPPKSCPDNQVPHAINLNATINVPQPRLTRSSSCNDFSIDGE